MITRETIVNELDSVPESLLIEVLNFIRAAKNNAMNKSSLYAEKLSSSHGVDRDMRDRTITQLLESFKTDEVSLETIDAEVEDVRAELYARQTSS
jgi:hypothetical protein